MKSKKGVRKRWLLPLSYITVLLGACFFSLFLFYFYCLNIPLATLTISTITIFSFLWIGFSWLLVRFRLTKDRLKEVLINNGVSYIVFLPLLTIFLKDMGFYNPNIWYAFLFIIVFGLFFFLKMRLIDWQAERKMFPMKSSIIPLAILSFFILFYIVVFTLLNFLRYDWLMTTTDLGGWNQIFWNTVRGRILHSTYWYGYNFLGGHMSPILILLAPIYSLWQDPRMLLFFQTFFTGITAIPIYLIAYHKLKDRFLSLVFACCWLLHPFLSRINLCGFYEVSLAPFLLSLTFLALIKQRIKTYFLLAFLCLMIKEEMSLLMAFFGVYIFFKHNKKIGIITIATALLWGLISLKLLTPNISPVLGEKATYQHIERYRHLGKNLSEIVGNILFHPIAIGKIILAPEKIITIILLFLPFGFFSLFSLSFLPGMPILLMHLIAYFPIQYNLFWHYSASILPFVAISAIYGFANIIDRLRKNRLNIAIPLSISILILSLFSNLYFNRYAFSYEPFPENPENYRPDIQRTFLSTPGYEMNIKERERIKLFHLLKELIPGDARVSCGESWASHLSKRKDFFEFIEAGAHWDKADYLLLDLSRRTPAFDRLLGYLDNFEKEGNFRKVFEETENNDFTIWVRKGKEEEILEAAKRLLKERPDSPHTHFILSSIYYHLGMLKDSQKEAEEVIKIESDYYNPKIYTTLGDTSLSFGEVDKAYLAYKKASEMESFRVVGLMKVKNLCLSKGLIKKEEIIDKDIERAISGLKKRLERNPNDIFIKKQLAFIYAQMGQYREAVDYLKEILSIEPNDPWAKQLFEQLKNFS